MRATKPSFFSCCVKPAFSLSQTYAFTQSKLRFYLVIPMLLQAKNIVFTFTFKNLTGKSRQMPINNHIGSFCRENRLPAKPVVGETYEGA